MHAVLYPHTMHASETPPPDLGRKAAAAGSPPLNPVDDPILNALRERVGGSGASTSRIARFLGVDAGVLLSWLAGRRKPRRATRERIAAFLQGQIQNGSAK
jgi:hypothetical protein